MPALHFDCRRLRRTAWATLVVWLFAVAAGVVNACVLAPTGAAERAAGQVSHAGIAARAAHAEAPIGAGHGHHPEQGEPPAHHGHGQDSGKAGCLKFCDDESSAIAAVKLPVVDPGSSLPTVVEPWTAIAATGRAGLRQSLQRPGAQGPPLVIRFVRLTL